MVLFNPEQSSTYCLDDGRCRSANRALDGDWYTNSYTETVTGLHWFQVSMADTLVYKMELKASTDPSQAITVKLLYNDKRLQLEFPDHNGGRETISVAEVLTADTVRLESTSATKFYLFVGGIEVTSAGIYSRLITIRYIWRVFVGGQWHYSHRYMVLYSVVISRSGF